MIEDMSPSMKIIVVGNGKVSYITNLTSNNI